jgi:glycosyltransferase involved in cell wall biosynthesis
MNEALAHHWLVRMRGGEKVLEQFCLLFPGAPIHTIVADPANLSDIIRRHPIRPSPLRFIPRSAQHYKALLPFFPAAVRRMKVARDTRFILSTDASVVKGLACPPGAAHVCYCHSPPRYLWDMQETYARHTAGLGALGRLVFRFITPYVRRFDYAAAQRVTHFIANAKFVQDRIKKSYGRDSVVIHPPVDVGAFDHTRTPDDFFLIVSELVPYKRVDIAIDAFNQLGKPLVIIGDGSEMAVLRERAGPTIRFLGRQPFASLKDHNERCRAFLYTQIEDFGITSVEAQAAGRPVIAFRSGGALESVIEGRTGMFFDEQDAASLADAVTRFERQSFDPSECRANAERFRPEEFRAKIKRHLVEHLPEHFGSCEFPS